MSLWLGNPGERFVLARAVDALAEAARQAGRPGLVWLAGLFYPAVGIGPSGPWSDPLHVRFGPGDGGAALSELGTGPQLGSVFDFVMRAYTPLFLAPFVAILFLPLFRLVAGLARVGAGEAWRSATAGRRSPRLRTLWALGSGLTLSTYGLWLQLVLMQILAFVVLLVPIVWATQTLPLASEGDRIAVLVGLGAVVGPVFLVFGLYVLALSVLGQLGLQSLVQNRRGVSSALLHAWRIMRQDPTATARAVLAELLLFAVTFLAVRALAGVLVGVPGATAITVVFQFGLLGFAGVVRAGYWARAYRELGGLTPADGVPGLARA
ncbi:MAG: hypothetical protein JNK02_09485 [Planctomycetes bacterium]|nr:hypothetical protein [Planctomycetota bacterium]